MARRYDIGHQIDAECRKRADRLIAELVESPYGVVARWQLLEACLGEGAIDRRRDTGRLHVAYRGVYSVGHRSLTAEGRWMATVLAGGRGAVLSHRSAAALWGILPSTLLEAIVMKQQRRRPGLHLRCRRFEVDELANVRGIPVTGVSRTLFDLAAILPRRRLERAMNEAEVRGLTDHLSLPDLLERYPGRPGASTIRAVLGPGGQFTRSDLEGLFLDFLDARGITEPETNAWIEAGGRWHECDCLWRLQRLVVELDSRTFHGTSAAFEADRARDRRLHVHGWRTIRLTWRQLQEEPEVLANDLRALLNRPDL
jgi:hypothetical protein